LRKKSENIIKPDVQGSEQDIKQTIPTNTPARMQTVDQELEGSELFSFFTANIIKEEKVFTR
jgi:hypothetical protein